MPSGTEKMDQKQFKNQNYTSIYWLGSSGALINTRGTTLMIDPVLSGFDMPLLMEPPLKEEDVPAVDAILYTHCDNDHFGRESCRKLAGKTGSFHAPHYVAELVKEEIPDHLHVSGHDVEEQFEIGNSEIRLTPAWHNWQNESPKLHTRDFRIEDYCGFWIDTPDGSVWAIGDSRLLDKQLQQPQPDAILFDFSDSKWHISLDGATRIAQAYPETPLILWHWGSVDAPEWKEFNGNPEILAERIINPERIVVLKPGEEFRLKKLTDKTAGRICFSKGNRT